MALALLTTVDLVNALVNQTFPAAGQAPTVTLAVGPNEYVGSTFQVTNIKIHYRLDRGSYNGLHGYWIFKADIRQCWQAVLNAGNKLAWWNADGQARGNPEDWELFVFEAENAAQGRVYIRNIYGAYVNFVGGVFQCSAPTQQQASVFTIVNE